MRVHTMARWIGLGLSLSLAACSSSSGADADSNARGDDDSAADASTADAATSDAGDDRTRCDAPGLVWRSAQKTNYTSYPEPGSKECVEYGGCMWQGQFAACDGVKSEAWVQAHDIAAAFPDFAALQLHELCLRSGETTIVVTVYDTCADSDCSGCCTRNQGSAEQLIDLESYTDQRFGVPDGRIEWADLGPTRAAGCD